MTVVVRQPGPPLRGLVRAITYQAGEQPRASVEKILPSPGTSLWVNLNRDEFRSYGDTGQVIRVPGAMLAGPTSRAAVIEFEQDRVHVSVTFALGAAACFFALPLEVARDQQLPLADVWGRLGASLRERLLEAARPSAVLDVMEGVLLGRLRGAPDRWSWRRAARWRRGFRSGRSRRGSACCPGPCAAGSRRRWGSARSALPGCSDCNGWFGTSTGSTGLTGRPWPCGTGTLTSRTWWMSSVSWRV